MDKAFHQSILISQLKQRGDNYLRKVFPDEQYAYQIRRQLEDLDKRGITYQVHGHCLNIAADGSCAGHAAPMLPNRLDNGSWVHPALEQVLQEATDQTALENWIECNQLDTTTITMAEDAPYLAQQYADGDIKLSDWWPSPISNEAFLLMITDTENGPIAMWATSHLQIEDYVLVDGKQYPCIKV